MNAISTMPGHLIRRLHQISVSIFADKMKSEGIELTSPQFAALAVLKDNPGVDQATLAAMVGLDRPTLGGVIERLAAKDLVERRNSETDRRAKQLELTGKGTHLLDRMLPMVAEVQAQILDGLTQDEQTQFTGLLDKIIRSRNTQGSGSAGRS